MALPSSGELSMKDLWIEWDKGFNPSSPADMKTMAEGYGVGISEGYGMNEFYSKRIIRGDASTWKDPEGSTWTDYNYGSMDNLPPSGSWDISYRLLGYGSGPNIRPTVSYSALYLQEYLTDNYDPYTLTFSFQYSYTGSSWDWDTIVYASKNIITYGSYLWNENTFILPEINTATKASNVWFRFQYEFNGAPRFTESFEIDQFNFSISSISGSNTGYNRVLNRDQWYFYYISGEGGSPPHLYWNAGFS
ncbi:MAG TPA: hypothetical protein PK122_05675 [Candidatus Paceibacterota bacterium]|nr:hypothetical protein [Candidatus Paceibacterota bacterium]